MRLLFSTVRRAGVRVRHHGDFDEAGVQILRDLESCYGAVPWRFEVAALAGALEPRPDMSPPPTLEDGVRRISCCGAEEMVIEDLLTDLRDAAR